MTDTSVAPAKSCASDFTVVRVIGTGAYATVFLVTANADGRQYAMKRCDKRFLVRNQKTINVLREKRILSACKAPSNESFIIRLYQTFADAEFLYFILEYADGGDTFTEVRRIGGYSVNIAQRYAAELLIALRYLHREVGVVHRDVKPENIVIMHDRHIRLVDFGTAKSLVDESINIDTTSNTQTSNTATTNRRDVDDVNGLPRRRSFVGSAQYVSPEQLSDKTVDYRSDLWSFGCVLYTFLIGKPPFHAESEYLIFQKILKGNLEFSNNNNNKYKNLDPIALSLIKLLLIVNPDERLTNYEEIMSHAFFEGIQWDKLHMMTPPPLPIHNHNDDDKEDRVRHDDDDDDDDDVVEESADNDANDENDHDSDSDRCVDDTSESIESLISEMKHQSSS